jgi:hypothetical protein
MREDQNGSVDIVLNIGLLIVGYLLITLIIVPEVWGRELTKTDSLDWTVSEGDYAWFVAFCSVEECELEFKFTQIDYANLQMHVIAKEEFKKFQACDDYSSVVSIEDKASHTFEGVKLEENVYFFVIDNNYCGSEIDESKVATGTLTDALIVEPGWI